MTRFRWISVVWVVIAALLLLMSLGGGDGAIVGGLLWLVWTAPIGMLWEFVLYDHVLPMAGREVADLLGVIVAYAGAYAFWFVLVPWLFRWARRRQVT